MAVVGELLSPAIGIAISPFPIVGLILILLSQRAKESSLFYMLGWLLGNSVVYLVAAFLLHTASEASGEPSTMQKIVRLFFGCVLILLAVKKFIQRPKKGEEAKVPKWFSKVEDIKPMGAFSLGLLLSAANPKNMLFGISAGVSVGSLSLTNGKLLGSLLLFVGIAGITVYLPTILFLIKGTAIHQQLTQLKTWLMQNNALIMSLLMLFIGINMISKVLG